MNKEEAKAYDKDPTVVKRQPFDSEDSSPFNPYEDIDELEYDEDDHAIFPF